MNYSIVQGNILCQPVDAIVNPWNRNIIPWWLLLPQGVSGAIKRAAGISPFKALGKLGPLPLGSAHLTGGGLLPVKGIIHVVGINAFWFATEKSVQQSVLNALQLANQYQFQSLAIPLIGAGSGNRSGDWSLNIIERVLTEANYTFDVTIVVYQTQNVKSLIKE